jgi:hypothetical protein
MERHDLEQALGPGSGSRRRIAARFERHDNGNELDWKVVGSSPTVDVLVPCPNRWREHLCEGWRGRHGGGIGWGLGEGGSIRLHNAPYPNGRRDEEGRYKEGDGDRRLVRSSRRSHKEGEAGLG